MSVQIHLHEIPLPGERADESRPQARVLTRGTIRLDDICTELRDVGVNSAQIKAVLDAMGKYMVKSLRQGYNFEIDGIGTFSLSLSSSIVEKEKGEAVNVKAEGLNFRCTNKIKKAVREIRFDYQKQSPGIISQNKRRSKMIAHLQSAGYINISRYVLINGCSRYQAQKDLLHFLQEGIITTMGVKAHKVYVLKG